MKIFAIGDLHLSDGDKPMDIFGAQWENHAQRIFGAWRERIAQEDIVLLPGDFSWAMQLQDAKKHLALLEDLPGQKILIRGNHDYWWSSVSRVRDALPKCAFALQNDAMQIGGVLFAGTRGWLLPGDAMTADDEKITKREVARLEMSLRSARRISEDAPLIVLMHFPPCTLTIAESGFTGLLEQYRAQKVVYGHLHGQALYAAFRGEKNGVQYYNASADGIDFKPILLGEYD